MAEILAENLSGKDVMGTDGAEIGSLYNITMDLDTGALGDLVVEPAETYRDGEFDRDEDGRLLVSVSRAQAVKDHMIVEQ